MNKIFIVEWAMFCPACQAEYREGFLHCADCEIELVAQLPAPEPAAPTADPASEDDGAAFGNASSDDPFCAFWEGDDPRVCVDICSVLKDAEIPYRVLRHDANLWRFTASSHMKVGVPFSLFRKAESVIGEAFSGVRERGKLLNPSQ